MTAFLGWTILVVVFCSFSSALLWPAFRALRRSYPNSGHLLWGYAIATVACSLGLWLLIPLAIHGFFGRAGH
jgi:hypothetical protein